MTVRNAVIVMAAGLAVLAAATLTPHPVSAQIKFNLLQCGLKDDKTAPLGMKSVWLKNTRSKVLNKGTKIQIRVLYVSASSGNPIPKEFSHTLERYLHPGQTIEIGHQMVLSAWEYRNCVAWPVTPKTRRRN